MNKEIKVVKQENDEIVLEEVNNKSTFMKKYSKYGILLLLLFLLVVGITVVINLGNTDDFVLDDPEVDIEFPDGDDIVIDDGNDNKPENVVNNGSNGSTNGGSNSIIKDPEHLFDEFFKIPDEVCFKIRSLILPDRKIAFYSDYSVKITYSSGKIQRVMPVNNNYSVDEKGNINPEAKRMEIKIVKTEETNHGLVTYYSDDSAEVEENNFDIWVGKKDTIKETYITENKLSYSNDIKEYEKYKVTDYHDGTIFIESGDKRYFVRDINDVEFTEDEFNFKTDNYAEVIKRVVLEDGFTVDYLSDGGAIIEGPEGNISVRKSNSIVIEDNKLVKVKVSNEVEEASRTEVDGKEVINLTNGSAIIKENDQVVGYIPENTDLDYKDNEIKNEEVIVPPVSVSTPNKDTNIYVFEDGTSFVDNKNNEPNVIDKSENIVIEEGTVAIINSDAQNINVSNIKINNKSSNKVKIRIVLENSDKTTLQNTFFKDVKFKISANNVEKSININPWDNNDNEYILYETELESKEEVEYQLGIWLDHEGLDNSAMGKSFYGTLKAYSWQQK